MEHLPTIISDLAYIMIVAGLVTIVFKRLKQPLVLGYIVAGFLAGPHMPYTPTVDDMAGVETWSQIGVIFMMFSLGLEFSFKKIVKMGMAPVLSSLCIMMCMIGIGSGVGWMFGWNSMHRLFLGGMLAMSSTTIIYKAFDDLGLNKKKFTKSVMSVLILEDILGILLMVVLSAVAVSRNFQGGDLAMSMLKLVFFLGLWFVVGIFVLPMFLKKNSKFINSETLLIFTVGVCFLMVMLASESGYSPAFGAFMMGSILAETIEAEHIEKVIGSIKDLFGAIFFVSVGMMVDPSILLHYWPSILVITASILIGQSVFGTMSFILSGQDLKGGMQCGFSMAQIGEFAFIIAALGQSLHVTDGFLYPVVVAVSVITTFLTPYMIKAAEPAYQLVQRIMPERVKSVIDTSSRSKTKHRAAQRWTSAHRMLSKQDILTSMGKKKVWKITLKQLFLQTAIYSILTSAAITLSIASLLPFFRSVFSNWPGNAICGILTICVIAPFLRPIVMRKNHSEEFVYLRRQGILHSTLLWLTIVLRFLLASYAVYYIFDFLSPYKWWLHILLSFLVIYSIVWCRWVKLQSIKLERTFRHNLTRRERLTRAKDEKAYARRLVGRDLHIVSLTLPDESMWGGKTLADLAFGRNDDIIVVAVVRGSSRHNIPGGNFVLYPRDTVEVIGDDDSIFHFSKRMEAEVHKKTQRQHPLKISCLTLQADSPFIGKSIRESGIRSQLNSIVIGIEVEDGTLSMASPEYIFQRNDTLWLVG
ncbi:MAG: cation:proton antiporter [Bacteroidales bacterium]|nr:cation:proton antiporter [Candidatus Physcousia equi]